MKRFLIFVLLLFSFLQNKYAKSCFLLVAAMQGGNALTNLVSVCLAVCVQRHRVQTFLFEHHVDPQPRTSCVLGKKKIRK